MPHVPANGVELFYEDFGQPDDPAILLVMGLGAQLILWPDAFVARLVAGGYRVIRYDNRDIGQSSHLHGAKAISTIRALISAKLGWKFPVAYTLTDMAADAVALLDALGIGRAHVVGASMGGMIAQLIAADWPDRVLSLTSIMSSSGAPGLPGADPRVQKLLIRKPPATIDRDPAGGRDAGGDQLSRPGPPGGRACRARRPRVRPRLQPDRRAAAIARDRRRRRPFRAAGAHHRADPGHSWRGRPVDPDRACRRPGQAHSRRKARAGRGNGARPAAIGDRPRRRPDRRAGPRSRRLTPSTVA